jgi:hypothetical protein
MRATFPSTAWTAFRNLPDGALNQRLPYLARRLHDRGEGALEAFLAALLAHQMPTQFAIAVALEHAASEDGAEAADRFSINTKTNTFFCRGCGLKGDAVDFVVGITGCSANEACEWINGTPRPDHTRDETVEQRNVRLARNAARLGELQRHEAETIEPPEPRAFAAATPNTINLQIDLARHDRTRPSHPRLNPKGEASMTDVELRKAFADLRQAGAAYDAAQAHPDRGKKTAAGYAAQGRLSHAADVLKEAEIKWERVRLEYLAEREEREAGQLPLVSP